LEGVVGIDLLQMHPQIDVCGAALTHRFVVHRFFDAPDPEALLAEVGPRIRALAGGDHSARIMDRLPALEIIANFGVGCDAIDLAKARSRGIRVTNTPGVLDDAVAEMAIGLVIALARGLVPGDRFARAGRWATEEPVVGTQLSGTFMGILGLGQIGKEIAARATALKIDVAYHGRELQEDQPYRYYARLADMARDVDWLIVSAPGGPATRGLVSREVLEALGSGCIVNVARGTIVDQAALVDLLVQGKLGGAALDVFENEPHIPPELHSLDNVLLSPHRGSATAQTRARIGQLMLDNLIAHFEGRPLLSPVV
jgi:lactate dehydrogenase-like 2-hydroxyacid dehydrogenase